MNDRTKRLRNLMAAHQLKSTDVAAIIGRSPATVRVWRCRTEPRIIPAHTLEILEIRLGIHA